MRWLPILPFALACSSPSNATSPVPAPPQPPPSDSRDGGVGGDAGAPIVPRIEPPTTRTEPDGPCDSRPPTSVSIVDTAGASVPPLSRIARLGSRWVGGGAEIGGFLTFADDGSASTPIVSIGAFDFTPTAQGLHVIDATEAEIGLRVFDERGAATSSRRVLATLTASAPPAVSVASGSGGAIAAWVEGRGVRAMLFDANGQTGATFDIAGDAREVVAAATSDGRFALVWSGTFEGGAALWSAHASPAGLSSAASVIVKTEVPRQLLRLIPTSSGFSILLAGREQVELMALDAKGTFRPPLTQYAGMRAGWDLAARGEGLLLAATRSDRLPAVRLLDVDGRPVSAWLCLTPNATATEPVSVAGTASGWVVTFRDGGDRQQLLHLNADAR